MRILVWALWIVLLLAVDSAADWYGIVRCQGEPPTCLNPVVVPMPTPATPPLVVVPPPVVPPVVVVVPPVVSPPRDKTPFVLPTWCPGWSGSDNVETNRPIHLFNLPTGTPFYATQDGDVNPSVSSHVCAGIIQAGSMTTDGRAVGNRRLWIPYFVEGHPNGKQTRIEYPDEIRCALATGRRCP